MSLSKGRFAIIGSLTFVALALMLYFYLPSEEAALSKDLHARNSLAASKIDRGLSPQTVMPITAPAVGRPEVADVSDNSLKGFLKRADRLIGLGRLDEALDEYLLGFHEARQKRPGNSDSQILLARMVELSRKYPPALLEIRKLREMSVAELVDNPTDKHLTIEVAVLNQRLGEQHRTIALYDSLPPDDVGRRQTLAFIAADALAAERRYKDVLVGKSYSSMLERLDRGILTAASNQADPKSLAAIRRQILEQTAVNIEVLAGAGQLEDALHLAERLFAYDDSEATHAYVQKKLARATGGP